MILNVSRNMYHASDSEIVGGKKALMGALEALFGFYQSFYNVIAIIWST